MRATIDAITGRVSMYRLATVSLVAVLALGVVLAFLDAIGADPYAILGTAGVVLVATLGANEVAARLARVVPHRESSVITALIIVCLVPPSLATMALVGAATASVIAALSKYLIVWRGRHLLNPAATGVFVASLAGLTIGAWWIATPAMLPVVALGALLLLDRTRRLDIGLIAIVLTVAIIGTRITLTGAAPLDAYSSVLLLFPIVFLAGFMLTEPLTLPPRRWQQWLTAAVVAVVFSVPFSLGPLYTSPELALVVGNIVAFAVSRRPGVSLRFLDAAPLSPHATELRFEPSRPLRFEAGQYLELHVPHGADQRGMRRSFTIASAPSDAIVRLGMRMPDPGSTLKRTLRELEPGARVATTLVAGDFLLPRDAGIPLVMLAGGIGVTPFASQLAELTARGERRDVVVLVVPSNPGEVLYRDVLEASGARVVEVPLESLTRDALLELVPDLASRRGFVSGAPAVVSAGRAALRAAGAKRVQTDYFIGY